ncbi:spermatogenesis-associated protein 16 isoform X3 [Parus major]|uniref:spermatogenesis-associated protein 16 isoform X3 n=1 Tax=Parus major TaxID=9157 RepID=UPI00144415C8|nr:spermatogenesis-associated protein 16 isoform X3 [Parus major]
MFPQQGLSSRAPEAWQEAKEHKERSQSGADRASRKRKAGSLGTVSGTKAETPAESGTGPFPSAPLHIPLSRLREIEAELICADEADTEFESGEPVAPAVPPAVPPAAAQPPGQAPGDSRWHRAGAGLQAALREGSARCRQRDFAAAAAKFSTALELCSKGFAIEDPLKSSPDDISRLASWIESKLVVCYLKLEQPGLALHHSHRSIIQNPSHFCNHLRQATCFRCLHRYSEAARSAMVAQCLYVLAEGAGLETSDLLQLYWQAMIQEAIRGESSFSALYTPFEKEDKADKIKEANKTFAEKHPDYVQHIFTDPHGIHLLPEKAESHPDQQYLLTLGFRNKEIGKTVEKFVTRKLPVFPGQKITFSPSMEEAAETFWQNTGERIMAAMAFLGSTKIKVALIEEYLREGEEHYLRTPRVQIPGMENINWTPRGQKYLRLENTNMFIPNPRSLATGPKKRHIVFAKS